MSGQVWCKLRNDGTVATVLVPMWQSSAWWGIFTPDGVYFIEEVVDWVWLPKGEHSLFFTGSDPSSKDVVPPIWPVLAVRVCFSADGDRRRIPLRDYVFKEVVCAACRSHSWHR
jgi:hypothetical protein